MDWSELSPDFLCLIAKKLGDISNFIRFRVVCKHWRSAVPPSELPPQLPWFGERSGSSDMKFYSFNTNKSHTLQVPELDGEHLVGASNKYLLVTVIDSKSSVLVNPLVRSQIQVPYRCCSIFDYLCAKHTHNHVSNPIEDNICVAMFMRDQVKEKDCLCLCRSKDGDWTKVEMPHMHHLYPAAFYKGNLFVSNSTTKVTGVVDVTNGNVVSVISGQGINFDYLIEAFGDLLGVVRLYDHDGLFVAIEECRFKVYRLEHGGNTPYWEEMSQGIGDLMLFLDQFGSAFCLKASDFDGLKGNNIYFIKQDWKSKMHSSTGSVLGRYDFEKDKAQMLAQHCFSFGSTWFVPSFC